MKNILIVVDMQKDFVDGSLSTKEAVTIVDTVVKKVKEFDGEVIFTRDTHYENYMDTQEGKNLPVVHCVKDTDGWQIIPELRELCGERNAKCYDKPTFGCKVLAEDLKQRYDNGEIASVELVGLCTDICVVSNALLIKAFMPELPVSVDSACCAGVTPEKHNAALETMRSCQIMVK
ncbi:MAG: cysteine hydrolase [Lachnospiraceae bacterium]|nr:cysteine hydrolase [Lachnospiraceae bacterium]